MTARYFTPSPLEIEDLESLGVTVELAAERETAHFDSDLGATFVTVGAVMLRPNTGRVLVFPRIGSERRPLAMPAMLTKAEEALLGRLDRFGRGVNSHGQPWAWTTVMLRVGEDDPLAVALAASQPFTAQDSEYDRLKAAS